MHETPAELQELQALLTASFARSSSHLTSIMEPPRRLSAQRLVADLPCPAVLNIATVTARGEPRISAVDGHFLHGRWYFGTDPHSPKARHLTARPAISASFTPRDGLGVFCHGRAVVLDGAERQLIVEHFTDEYGRSPEEWAPGALYARIDPTWLVAFAMTDAELAQIEADRATRQAGGTA